MFLNSSDLEYVSHLQAYLDRLIKLQENGHTVSKEVNDVLTKINRVYRIGEQVSAYDLVGELKKLYEAKDMYAGETFNGKVVKATVKFEYENGDVQSVDVNVPSTIVIIPDKK